MNSDTPRTDAFESDTTESKGGRIIDNFTRKDLFNFARQLERELNEANKTIAIFYLIAKTASAKSAQK